MVSRLATTVTLFAATIALQVPALTAQTAAAPPDFAKLITLKESQVKQLLSAVDELKKNEEVAKKLTVDSGRPLAFAESLRAAGQAESVLHKFGFASITEFQRVGYNASMAHALVKNGGKQAMREKMAASKAEQAQVMAQMKGKASEEQLKMISEKLAAAYVIADEMQNVPDENVTLMAKYTDQMEKLVVKKAPHP